MYEPSRPSAWSCETAVNGLSTAACGRHTRIDGIIDAPAVGGAGPRGRHPTVATPFLSSPFSPFLSVFSCMSSEDPRRPFIKPFANTIIQHQQTLPLEPLHERDVHCTGSPAPLMSEKRDAFAVDRQWGLRTRCAAC
ncbi:hypothetical protein FOCC_FOCC006900 [Frankliniella occidentalis]|nr:hypothetical protein FOCC_FOCC006900 [Frankliniella occidentalis]